MPKGEFRCRATSALLPSAGGPDSGAELLEYVAPWFVARVRHLAQARGSSPREPVSAPRTGFETSLSWRSASYECQAEWSSSVQFAGDEQREVCLLLQGHVTQRTDQSGQASALLTEYLRTGLSMTQDLDGSFSILILDARQDSVTAVTDPINSRRIFLTEGVDEHWLSTSLHKHPVQHSELSPAALGSLLTSGVMHSNLTPFEGVIVLERASIHHGLGYRLRSEPYWSYDFETEHVSQPEGELVEALAGLLRESIWRCMSVFNPSSILVSLSGGHDSKSILGFLAESEALLEKTQAFSYHHGVEIGDSDAASARLSAELLGVPWQCVEAYNGDLSAVIIANGHFGQGMANFCEEVSAWLELAPSLGSDPGNLLVTGDMFAPARWGPRDRKHILDLIRINPASHIEWFLRRLEPASAAAIRIGWDSVYEGLLNRMPPSDNLTDIHHYMYLDQRISNTLMLWRECFQRPFLPVITPYLDRNLLDFWRKVPADLRDRKLLYKRALKHALPELFRLPISGGNWNPPDWSHELRVHGGALRDWLREVPSRLDAVVPPGVLVGMLDDVGRLDRSSASQVSRAGKNFLRRSRLLRRAIRAGKTFVSMGERRDRSLARAMLSLLSLRAFLARPGDDSSGFEL